MSSCYFPSTFFAPSYFGGTLGLYPLTTTNAPNPNETVWTLGYGGATWDGTVSAGADLFLSTQLLNNGLAVAFASGDVPSAAIWPGGGEGTLFSPTVAWDAVTGGYAVGRITLAIAANSTVALDPATYRLQMFVTSANGTRSLAFDGQIKVTGVPGTVTAGQVACSYEDMLLYSDQIASLNNRAGVDAAGFLNQRARITAEFYRDLVLRYKPMQGLTRIRQNIVDPIVGEDVPTTNPPTSKEVVTTALASNGLILEAKAREIAARRAIALVLDRQMDSRYAAEAASQRAVADQLFGCFVAQIDLNGDGVPEIEIMRDCTFLPTGTAP